MTSTVQRMGPAPERAVEAWQKRRPAWTRTDTARWLDERSATILAWLRRRDPQAPTKNAHAMGRWLQASRPQFFARAHGRLGDCGEDAARRDRLGILEVLS